jgi:hypothetical protein
MTNAELRAVEYRTRAREALATAGGCALDHVRELHEQAAARWEELASIQVRSPTGAATPDASRVSRDGH